MRINHNLMAMNTHRMLGINNQQASNSVEKLSSGLRINRAGDDAAGLAISEKMRAQIRGLGQSSRNSQDAISLIQTAEGATNEAHAILQRMRELAIQSANDTNVSVDRTSLQNEVNQLTDEIDRIADTTEFNGITLLNGTGGSQSVSQATIDTLTSKLPGYLDDAMDAIESYMSLDTPVGTRDMDITYYYDENTTTGASMGTADGGASLELRVNLANVTDASGNLIPEGSLDTLLAHEMMHAYQFTNMTASTDGSKSSEENWFWEGLSMAIQGGNLFAKTDQNVDLTDPFDGDYKSAYEAVRTLHEITDGGINAIIDALESGDDLDAAINNTTQDFAGTELAGASGAVDFTDVEGFTNWFNADADGGDANLIGDVSDYIDGSSDFSQGSGAIDTGGSKGSSSNLTLDQTITNDAADSTFTSNFNHTFTNPNFAGSGGNLTMQIGANEGQTLDVTIGNLKTTNLGIQSLDISTRDNASKAISTLDSAIESVSNLRSNLGATQNRLEHTIKNLDTSKENLQASESRIRDVDMASEMMQFTKSNILQQAAQSMLAQANNQPQGVLQLLG